MSRWPRTLLLLSLGVASGVTATAAELDRGREIYNYRCYFCHGYSGNAQTLASTYLQPRPLDFTRADRAAMTRARMIDSVTHGRPGTAMHGFARLLDAREIGQVVDFVRDQFMQRQNPNTRYHTDANGWPRHERYRAAFAFATGEIPLNTPWRELSADQARGKRLYLRSCITCHDRAVVTDEGPVWRKQAVSYPRNRYSPGALDAVSAASIYARHDARPTADELSPQARQGRLLWRQNCAFCHAVDGSGENWIGSFLESGPRNLTDTTFMRGMTRERLRARIRDGLRNTSMPAWRDVLSPLQIDQIISYIDAAFHPLEGE